MIARALAAAAGAASAFILSAGLALAAEPATAGSGPWDARAARADTSGRDTAHAALVPASATRDLAASWTGGWTRPRPMPEAVRADALACLAEAVYFEARGEPARGQFAVAEVILNRVASREFPDAVCAVVNQGTGVRDRCQFSYTCDGRPETVGDADAYARARKISTVMLAGAPRVLTGGALYYHTRAVDPYWAALFERTATIGAHHFYNSDGWRAS